jgi:superfamily II DNA/RNA helicase
MQVSATVIFGGVSMGPQINALRRGVDVVIATPGRLMDHMQQRTLDLSGVETLILDEADRMLDMGFLPALKRILVRCRRSARRCCSRPPSHRRSRRWRWSSCTTRARSR